MDADRLEEKIKLDEIEKKIDSIIVRYEKEIEKYEETERDFPVIDQDDRENLAELRRKRKSAQEKTKEFKGYKPSPYIGRIDLETDDNEIGTYYVGKADIHDKSESVVIDWRSPIGSIFNAKNEKEFTVKDKNYLLALRRAIFIEDCELRSCVTEYSSEIGELYGDVIDSFLIEVMKDKRRHRRLTDIIRTIQGSQNEIIRKPSTESFVVQGCAGSGKTMILLHRLSTLLYNNPNLQLNGVKIITPNKFFDAHIDDLSVELGLTEIQRFSVEEYYVHLIKKYSNNIQVSPEVLSEKTLNEDLLRDIYSAEYLSELISRYHDYWNAVLTEIDEEKLRGIFKKNEKVYPKTEGHNSYIATELEQKLELIAFEASERERKRKEVFARLMSVNERISLEQTEYAQAQEKLEEIKKETVDRISHETAVLEESLQLLEKETAEMNALHKKLQERQREIKAGEKKDSDIFLSLSQRATVYSDYDQISRLSDETSKFICSECSDIIGTIKTIEDTFAKIPVYNFGKKNEFRRKLVEAKELFSASASNVIAEQIRKLQESQGLVRANLISIEGEIKALGTKMQMADAEVRSKKKLFAALQECARLFSTEDYPNTRMSLLPVTHKACGDILTFYEKQRKIWKDKATSISELKKTKTNLEMQQQTIGDSLLDEDEREYISGCLKNLERIQFGNISRIVMYRSLKAKYKEHSEQYKRINYRHKLYLRLLFCALYYPRPVRSDYFLNIDEAQDISVSEYNVLRMILGNTCIFNLYGDVNQTVYSYKGISDWEDLREITDDKVYVLNENYRNTMQITEFCNMEFGADVYPIGISGAEVNEMSTKDAVDWVFDIKEKNPDYRVAIIHRHGLKAVQEALQINIDNRRAFWHTVDDKEVSVISAEEAKGLEFDAVVVIASNMSMNEKYISYTRALDHLVVVRDAFANELIVDEESSVIDDESMGQESEF